MKAIVLAAGMGTRLEPYTSNIPKCLLPIAGKPILEHQVDRFRRFGIQDITVVKGYLHEQIAVPDVRYYVVDKQYNMLYSLFCAEQELQGDVIISYGDIVFQDSVLDALLHAPTEEVSVVADTLWEEYYRERFEHPFLEAESFIFQRASGRISRIGDSHPAVADVQAQYVGLIRLSPRGCSLFRKTYTEQKELCWGKRWMRGRSFENAYMTDFLQHLIDHGVAVGAVLVKHGWLELDTVSDYEKTLEWQRLGELARFCDLG